MSDTNNKKPELSLTPLSLKPEVDEIRQRTARSGSYKAADGTQKPNRRRKKNSGFPWAWCVAMLAIMGVAYVGYLEVTKLQGELDGMRGALNSSKESVNESVGELQSALSSTSESLTTRELEVAEKLKFLDAEMRKLWAVYQANKPKLKDMKQSVDQLKTQQTRQQHSMSKLANTVKKVDDEFAQLNTQLVGLEALIEQQKKQNEQVSKLASKKELEHLEQQLVENGVLLKVIDQHRRQVNQRLDQLTTEVRKLMGVGEQSPGL